MVDHYAKWAETCLLEHKTGERVAKAIEKLIINKHGVPDKYGITIDHSSPYHHNTTGAVERLNQTIMEKLRKIANYKRKNLKRNLELATYATNISFNRAIGTSPFVLKSGKEPVMEIDRRYGKTTGIIPATQRWSERDKNWKKYANKAIEKGKVVTTANFATGDKVLVYKTTETDKFAAKWMPGFKITKRIPPDAFEVENGKEKYRVNKKHIKLACFHN